ncbi:hypothetical protein EON66_10710 [archaeon]|nr:MAG: hypothetical protein EON66_10710 [archaeon]
MAMFARSIVSAHRWLQVENLFYFSFLVKANLCGIVHNEHDDAPHIYTLTADSAMGEDVEQRIAAAVSDTAAVVRVKKDSLTRQFAWHIDMASWELLCKQHKLTAPRLPHVQSKDSTAPASFHAAQRAADVASTAAAPAGSGSGSSATGAGVGAKRRRPASQSTQASQRKAESTGDSVDGSQTDVASGTDDDRPLVDITALSKRARTHVR